MKGKLLLLICTVLFIALISNVLAISGSIGNARMILYPVISGSSVTIDKTILVKNINNVSVNIVLNASGNDSAIFKIIDSSFTLKAGEEKDAAFQITVKHPGEYQGQIDVQFSPADNKGAGVGLASTIIVVASRKGDASNTDNTDTINDSQNTNANVTNQNQNNINKTTSTVNTDNAANTPNNPNTTIMVAALIGSALLLILVLVLLILILKKMKKGKRSDRNS